MASTSSSPEQKPIALEAFGEDVLRRRVLYGAVEIPRNSGTRRTESKRALLAAIKDAGGDW